MNKVLIIGTVWIETTSAAGSRLVQLIEQFSLHGYHITFASSAQKTKNSITLPDVNNVDIDLNASTFDAFVKTLQPDIVVFDRFMTEEQFGWRVADNCPNALRVLDTEDLHCLRKVRHQQLKKGISFSLDDLLVSDIAKREIASILRCDLSLIISPFEIDVLTKVFKIGERLLLHVPFLLNQIESKQVQMWLPFEKREHFIFIGNFLHAPNVDAVLQLKQIWNSIQKKRPNAELHIYGAYATQQINQLHNEKEGFLVKGFVKEAYEVVKRARVVLAPLRFGAGTKGKLTEAMICGTPSVTTSIGAEGMHQNLPWNGFIEDDFKVFTEKAITLYTDKLVWKTAQQNGIEIINRLYDKKIWGKIFIKKIQSLRENLDEHRRQNFLGSMLQHQTLNATKYMSKWIEAKNNQSPAPEKGE